MTIGPAPMIMIDWMSVLFGIRTPGGAQTVGVIGMGSPGAREERVFAPTDGVVIAGPEG
jgi:hypothetical protein